jgi:hypothetical protein
LSPGRLSDETGVQFAVSNPHPASLDLIAGSAGGVLRNRRPIRRATSRTSNAAAPTVSATVTLPNAVERSCRVLGSPSGVPPGVVKAASTLN